MAEAFFNKLNKDNNYLAVSAGTHIGTEINPICVSVMKELGIDISQKYPKQVSEHEFAEPCKIFTMGCDVVCDLPGRKFDADWNLDDPTDKGITEVRKTRDLIQKKVSELIDSLR